MADRGKPKPNLLSQDQLESIGMLQVLWLPLLVGIIVISCMYRSSGFFLAAASFAASGLLGFLFGIPRVLARQNTSQTAKPEGENKSGLKPNTNLEDVSDWLTKIVLGLGLTNIKGLIDTLERFGNQNATVFQGAGLPAQGKLIAECVVIFFSAWGFLLGYVLTRLFLQKQIAIRDLDAENASKGISKPVNIPILQTGQAISAQHMALNPKSFRRPDKDEEFRGRSGGLPIYQFEVSLAAEENILERVEQVVYEIPGWPSSSSPKTVTDPGENFKIKDLAWGQPFVRAFVKISGQSDPVVLTCTVPLTDSTPHTA